MSDNRASTIEELERDVWPAPPADATRLIRSVHALRRKPLDSLTVEDLRVLLSQGVGADVVTPVALDLVAANPLAEGDYYPGDLLVALLKADGLDDAQRARLREVVRTLDPDDPDYPAETDLPQLAAAILAT